MTTPSDEELRGVSASTEAISAAKPNSSNSEIVAWPHSQRER